MKNLEECSCINYQSNVDVPITDQLTEFARFDDNINDYNFLDVGTRGTILLQAGRPGNQVSEAVYILRSPDFQQFGGVREFPLPFDTGLPADVSITLSGAQELANNTVTISIPSFTVPNTNLNFIFALLLVSAGSLEGTAYCMGLGSS